MFNDTKLTLISYVDSRHSNRNTKHLILCKKINLLQQNLQNNENISALIFTCKKNKHFYDAAECITISFDVKQISMNAEKNPYNTSRHIP